MRSSRASGRVRAGRGVWLGVVGCLLCAGCTIERADVRTPSGEPPETDISRVRAAVEAIADAIERGDRSGLDTLYHDSLVVYRSGRVERRAPEEDPRSVLGLGSFELDPITREPGAAGSRGGDVDGRLRIEDLEVRLEGGTALATFRFRRGPTRPDGAEPPSAHGLATFILRQTGGGWELIHAHISEES